MSKASPRITIPLSSSTVTISIIDTTTRMVNMPGTNAISPLYPGWETYSGPSYSFLIHHAPSDAYVLFDLGMRKDWKTAMAPAFVEAITSSLQEPATDSSSTNGGEEAKITVEKNTTDILSSHGFTEWEKVQAVIYSHHHWDHTGDPSAFPPSTTKIVLGPGYKAKYLPGWPANPDPDSDSVETTSDLYAGREVVEVNFAEGEDSVEENTTKTMTRERRRTCSVGAFKAIDWFGDGSFYLLDTGGHTTGHLSALARTTAAASPSSTGGSTIVEKPGTNISPKREDHGEKDDSSTFIFLGGDIAHHCAVFRPSPTHPLPADSITPDPRVHPRHHHDQASPSTKDEELSSKNGLQDQETSSSSRSCPTALYTRLHRCYNRAEDEDEDEKQTDNKKGPSKSSALTTPFALVSGPDDDPPAAQRAVDNLLPFDGNPNVLTVFAHDETLLDVVDFYPATANAWKARGWGWRSHWRFLGRLRV